MNEIDIRRKLRRDFKYYANKVLKIRSKSGKVMPFELNKPQQYLHDIAEKQYAETGKIRLNILKGRQEGVSTYVEGRFYWKTTQRHGVRAFILTHEEDATKNLKTKNINVGTKLYSIQDPIQIKNNLA